MNKFYLIAALAAAAYFAVSPDTHPPFTQESAVARGVASEVLDHGDAELESAFVSRLSNLQVAGQGTVLKVLPDDNDGSRHQRIIIRLESGRTLLLAHNINLARRIDSLRTGDHIAFYGEYEWNPKGGVVHWTHHDPKGQHPAGWIKHGGITYQ
jgi:hypothetical protein